MSQTTTPKTYTQAEVDAMIAASAAQPAPAANAQADIEAAAKAASDAASARISAILDNPAAATRPAMAKHLAFKTNSSAEEAIALLAVAGEEKPAANAAAPQGQRAKDAPGGLATAGLEGGSTEANTEKDKPVISASSIYGNRRKAEAEARKH